MDRKVMQKITYGLFVLTAREGEKDNGCIVNTVSQVTTTPNRIIVTVNKENYTHDMIQRTGVFNLSVLDESAEFSVFQRFGFQSGRDTDKLEDFVCPRSENGIVYIPEMTNAYISAKVISAMDLGTHTMFLAEVTGGDVLSDRESVSYTYYHKNIKPSANVKKKKGWICQICGYVYEEEVLPEDFICPICKHPASDFVKL